MIVDPKYLQPVRFTRQVVTASKVGKLPVGRLSDGHVVLAVKFANQGVNSKVGIGDKDGLEWINEADGPEVSFGVGHLYAIDDEFIIKFEKIDTGISDANTTHCCLVVMTVLKKC